MDASALERKGTRREIFAWAMYDWANSAYTTLSITMMMFYITGVVLAEDSPAAEGLSRWAASVGYQVDPGRWGGAVWACGLAVSMLVAALLSPVLGAIADARASKRHWLAGTALTGATCSAAIFFVPHQSAWLVIGLFLFAALCFDLSFGFYNGFLPEISDDESINRISAWGYALGYLGGGLALLMAMMVLKYGDDFGIEGKLLQLRTNLLIMGLWWGVFTIPTILWLRDRGQPTSRRMPIWSAARAGFAEVRSTLRHLKHYRILVLFLLGFLFFNDGIQTVISQATFLAKADLKFEPTELLTLTLVFQFVCLLGALQVGFITDRLGQKYTLLIYLAVWTVLLIAAFRVETKAQFWALSFVLGMVMGGTQSVARAIMGKMTPVAHTAKFFGFYNFSGKATSWMGNMTFGTIFFFTEKARLGILCLIPFFLIGIAFILAIDVARGQRQAMDKSL